MPISAARARSRRRRWRWRISVGRCRASRSRSIFADHQNKPDVGSNIARQWYDQDGVDAIIDVPTSSVALAVNEVIAREEASCALISGAGDLRSHRAKCSPTACHWTYDTYALAHVTGGAVVKSGGDTWFFITADYAFGHALERDTASVVKATGGKVLGNVGVPLNSSDFSSFLLQAQASKAKIIGLANAGGDTINSIKQAPSSASSRADRNSPGCSSSSPTCTASASRRRRGCSSPRPSIGT